jgi:RNA polymerase sigma-70 factor, ECF subfamily
MDAPESIAKDAMMLAITEEPKPKPEVMKGEPAAAAPKTFAEVYAENASFVWRSMRRLGVRPGDVEDTCQEVFLVVHSRFGDFKGGSLRSWLFAIALRVAADYRKRAFVKREVISEEADSGPDVAVAEEQTASVEKTEAIAILDSILSGLDDDKRAVFILFELEQMSMHEVATAVGCPLQTAYTRLHAARDQVNAAIERFKKKKGGTAAR